MSAVRHAVVLLSGGLDSATVLALAQSEGFECHCLSVDYGQRHAAELEAAQQIAGGAGVDDHRIVRVDLTAFGGSALTGDLAVPVAADADVLGGAIPVTYVPARNTVLLSLALALAEVTGAQDVFIGANAVDYSGYPDCRPEYLAAFEAMAALATRAAVEEGQRVRVRAPLVAMSKAEIIRTGLALGVDYAETVTCYTATEVGAACGVCEACVLRRTGFHEAGVPDPTRYVV